MNEQVKELLKSKYNNLKLKKSCTCLKYYYMYHDIHVNLFFDAYDPNCLSLCLILSNKKQYYFTPLNISDSSIHAEYLSKIPIEILSKILVDKHLNDFYESMEEHILSNEPHVNFYINDTVFVNTIRFTAEKDLPFWSHIRRVRMTDKTLKELNARADISYKTLLEIQAKNLTLVRTADALKRKKLTMILSNYGITIK